MSNENNKMQVDIENLFKQNVNDLLSIKELYRKLKEVEEKILQIKYIDTTLANKLKKDYEKLKKLILDENAQANLANEIEKINSQIEKINTQMNNTARNFLFFGGKSGADFDNTSALQKLVNNLHEQGGGTIFIPEGVYYFNSPVYWESDVNLKGQGIGQTILKTRGGTSSSRIDGYSLIYSKEYSNDTSLDDIEPIKNINFSDFTVNGEELNMKPSYKGKGIFIQKLYDSSFRNLKFEGTGSTALGVDMLHHCLIENVICENCGRTYEQGSNTTGCAGIGIGTGGLPIENLVISNCQTYGCGQFGIFIEDQAIFGHGGGTPKGININNCICIGGKNHGFGVKGGHNTIISNCQAYENKGYGLAFEYNAKKVNISNCQFTENIYGGIGFKYGNYYFDIQLNNNIISYNTGNGIDISYNNEEIVGKTFIGLNIEGNIIRNNGGYGINVNSGINAGLQDVNIINNQILDNTLNGIKSDTILKNGIISNNTILRNAIAQPIKDSLLLLGGTSSIDINNNNLDQKSKGKILLNNSMCILTKENNITKGNKIILIKFRNDGNSTLLRGLYTCFDLTHNSSLNPKGYGVFLNSDNKIKLIGRTTNDGEENSITFDKPIVDAEINTIKIEITPTAIKGYYLDSNNEYILMDQTVSGTLTDISSIINFYENIYIGAYYQGSNGVISNFNGVIYNLKVYANTKEQVNFYFDNIGINKEIIDRTNGLKGVSCYGAKQYYHYDIIKEVN